MRVIHLVKHCRHGNGNAHVAVDLACVQAQRDYGVVYASAGGNLQPLLDGYGVRQQRIVQDRQSLPAMARSFGQLLRLCKSFQPDVLHAHMMSSAVFGYAAAKFTGIPLLTTVHNSFDRHSVIMRLGRKVVAVSQAERTLLLRRGFGAAQVAVVLNGPNDSPREAYGEAPRLVLPPNSIVTLCGLHHRKGVHDLIQAFSMAQREVADWHFYVIGDGPDRQALEALAAAVCSPGLVHFLGAVDRPQALLKQAAIFVLASYADPCALVLGEARAAGCAVIATDVGGTAETLAFGKAGQLVAPRDPAQFAAKLVPLMRDGAALQKWRGLALQNVAYLSIHRVVDDYARIYDSLRR